MLDIKFIRENLDAIKVNCANRNISVNLERFSELDNQRRKTIASLEEIRKEQNDVAASMKSKIEPDARQKLIERGKELKNWAQEAEEKLRTIEAEFDLLVRQIPNMTHPDSPVASTEEGNREIRKWGKPTAFNFKALDHLELGEKLDLIDFEMGAKVVGQKFYYLKNEAVLLEQALITYALHTLQKEGFTPIMTPDLARSEILDGIGFNPRGEETQIYSVENSDLCLIATAEITLGGMMSQTIMDEDELPLKYVGVSHCFRTEAGAAGKESKGLYRVHQFTKVEMFAFTTPEASETMHDEFLKLEEKLFQGLEIPYRAMDICTGDMGGPAYRKYDLEAWMPGRGEAGAYGEVTSTSNCTDYQARRLGIRFRRQNEKKPIFVHMLNGTAIAISRALIAILENYQQKDGSILVPKALAPYMNGIERIER
ncbi:MAG: serine--tRNA ligase [Pseudomonadota bacterium]